MKALDSRFMTTRWSFVRIDGGDAARRRLDLERDAAFRPARTSKCEAMKRTSAATSVSCSSILSLPASSLEMSSRSLTCLSSMRALRTITCAVSRCSRAQSTSRHSCSRSAGPRIRASGVRSSWLTLAKNWVLISSSSRMRSSSPCSSMFLLRDFLLLRFLLGDVAPLGSDEDDVAVLILDRAERGVDDDRLLAAGASVDRRIPAHEFAWAARAIDS